ncbi:unnamed protein product [Brassica rapa subsp. narinosa]
MQSTLLEVFQRKVMGKYQNICTCCERPIRTIRSKSYKRFSSSPLYVGLYCRFDTDGW